MAEFVGPNDGGVVQERPVAVRLLGLCEPLGKVGDLLAVPVIDLGQLVLGFCVGIGAPCRR